MKGSSHWKSQRISAVALLPVSPLFITAFVTSLGRPQSQIAALWSSPVHALVAIAFLTVAFAHLWQGLHEVITDYVHGPSRRLLLLAINTLCFALPLVAIIGLVRMAFFQDA